MTATVSPKKPSLLTPLLLRFMLAMILANLGGSMYGPLEALYLQDLGASIGQIGLFYTLSQIIPLMLQILGGWVSDSLGRLPRHRHRQRRWHPGLYSLDPGRFLGMGLDLLCTECGHPGADRPKL